MHWHSFERPAHHQLQVACHLPPAATRLLLPHCRMLQRGGRQELLRQLHIKLTQLCTPILPPISCPLLRSFLRCVCMKIWSIICSAAPRPWRPTVVRATHLTSRAPNRQTRPSIMFSVIVQATLGYCCCRCSCCLTSAIALIFNFLPCIICVYIWLTAFTATHSLFICRQCFNNCLLKYICFNLLHFIVQMI